ncbi:hypothetical protein Tco_1258941 [Tanacetum coccineum]
MTSAVRQQLFANMGKIPMEEIKKELQAVKLSNEAIEDLLQVLSMKSLTELEVLYIVHPKAPLQKVRSPDAYSRLNPAKCLVASLVLPDSSLHQYEEAMMLNLLVSDEETLI